VGKTELMEAVRKLREQMGLTQTQFAGILGRGMSTIQRWEQVVPPRGPSLAKLARVANEAGRPDIAATFERALAAELGEQSGAATPVAMVWVDTLNEIRQDAPAKFDRIIGGMAAAIEQVKGGVKDPIRFNRLERLLVLLRRMIENKTERALMSEVLETAQREGIPESAAFERTMLANSARYGQAKKEREKALRGTQHAAATKKGGRK
jgi:transcriptional regulator with XRE-family HTH domain